MSDNAVPGWIYTSYIDQVVQQLQTKGYLLQGTAMPATNANGNEVEWFTGGRMETSPIDRTIDDAPLSTPARGKLKKTFEDWGAQAFVKGVDINKIKPNELTQLSSEGRKAIGRRSDWIQLDEMFNRATTSEPAATRIDTIGDGSAAIDIPDLMEAEGAIMGIGDTDVMSMFCVMPATPFRQLLLYKEFNNADYTGPDLAFKRMTQRRTWMFTNYFVLPDEYFQRTELGGGTIDDTTGEFYGLMWWRGAIGFQRKDPPADVKMQYSVPKRGTYIDNQLGAVSRVLQPKAIKRLHFKWPKKPSRPV